MVISFIVKRHVRWGIYMYSKQGGFLLLRGAAMYRSAFWMVHICLFGCQAGSHLWSVQCLVSLNHHLVVQRLKSPKPRSRERSFHFCLMDERPIDRPHQDGAMTASSIRQKWKFTILHGCSRQEGPPYPALYSHVNKGPP